MSFFLDPPTLVLLGIVLAILNKKLISSQITRILGFLILLVFWGVSGALFLDWIPWPFNLFDITPPIFEEIGGKAWMLHTDITGITDIPIFLAILLFLTYPFFLILGYEVTRAIIDPHRIKILSGDPLTVADVKSRSRARRKVDPVLLAAVRDPKPIKALNQALDLLGGIGKFVNPGDKVIIKPNICGGNPEVVGSFTSINLVEELIRLIKAEGAEVIGVVDSDMVWIDFEDIAKAEGWIDWAKEKNIPLINLRKTDCVRFDFGSASKVHISIVSKLMVDADVIISFPSMKTHLMTGVTLGMKNMYGTFPEGDKAKYHEFGIDNSIAEMNFAFTPTLTIIDGSIGGEAIGPLTCKKPGNKEFETIIVSNDVVAADALATIMMGFDPMSIEHIKKAHELEIGRADVTFDWSSFTYNHPRDGKWIRPDPKVCDFYNDAIQFIIKFPFMRKFMDASSDFLLYDTATLPIFENVTPAVLGVLSDIFSAIFNVWGKMKGGRKKHLIASEIEKIKQRINAEEWPSEQLQKQLLKIGTTPNLSINPQLVTALDITKTESDESAKLAYDFNPNIILKGVELRSEKKARAYGGMMYRVLENQTNPNERCIQYLYTWVRQKWFFSGWYNIIAPLFLSALSIGIFSQTGIESKNYTYLSIGLTIAFLLLTGSISVIRTLRGWRRKGKVAYIYRHGYSLIFYAIIFTGLLFELPSRWNGETVIPSFPLLWETVYIPLTSIIFLIVPIFVLIIIIQPFISVFTHQADYAPVFVYLNKNNGGNWGLEKVRYDKFHHDVTTRYQRELSKKGLLKNKKQIKLAIPNSWHSMETNRGFGRLWSTLGFIGFFLSYIALGTLWYFYPEAVETLDLFALTIAISLIFAYAYFTLAQTKLQKFEGIKFFNQNKNILTNQKLRILWNLSGTDPALKVRQKMQDPFNPDTSGFFWDSFFDIKDDRTIMKELKAIQERTKDIASLFIGLLAAGLAIAGFYYGGFWSHSSDVLETPNYGWILTFFVCFGVSLIIFLIYSVKFDPKPLLITLIISALIAEIDEAIFTFANFWNYLEGEPISLLFAVFGWPVFFTIIIGFSNWILKYINLPEYKNRIGAKLLNLTPVLLLTIILGVFFVLEGFLDELFTLDTTRMALVAALIGLSILFALIFGITHTFKQNLVLMVFAMIFGGAMEILGTLAGFWSYFTFTQITPDLAIAIVPNFLIIFWAFRVYSILLVGRVLKQRIVRAN
ncbi:MAG: DUF362 domain-containing protein [Candidatus Hodarchaeota archaeon]